MDNNINKDGLRNRIKKLRAEMPSGERKEKDQLIYNNIISSGILDKAGYVYIFVSYGTEADTKSLIVNLLNSPCHRVCVPRVNGNEMEFYIINSMDDLKPGYNGILEPAGDTPVVNCDGIMFMPGLVFDKYHNRIGYGGGYYDRYLYRYKNNNIFKAAVAYDFQVLKTERIGMEAHDIKPDIIITESTIYQSVF